MFRGVQSSQEAVILDCLHSRLISFVAAVRHLMIIYLSWIFCSLTNRMHVHILRIRVIWHVTPCLYQALRRKLAPLYSKIHGTFETSGIAHGHGVTSQMTCNPQGDLISRECSISLSFKTWLLFSLSIHSVVVDCTGHVVSAGNTAVSYCRRVRFVSRPEHSLSWGFTHVFSFLIGEC
jgi:hypothetical protein